MTNEELRKSICGSLKMADRRTLKMIQAMLTEYFALEEGADEKELYEELDRRRKAYKSGKDKILTVAEVKVRYLKRRAKRKS